MKFENVVIGLIIALLIDQVIEASAGVRAANVYVALMIAGVAMYQRPALERFAGQLERRLAE